MVLDLRLLLLVLLQCICTESITSGWKPQLQEGYPDVPVYGPQPNAPYMVDNTHNYFHVAPDKGKQDGPAWPYSGSLNNYMSNLRANKVIQGGFRKENPDVTVGNFTYPSNFTHAHNTTHAKLKRQNEILYWLPNLAPLGVQPLAGSGYTFFRNIVDDYKADPTGKADSSEAINAAVSFGNRCGKDCGNTFTQGAIIYFPPGTYRICSPIIQLYYTQFIGNALSPPTIQGCETFKGIALIDTDVYNPGGSGSQWYVNQNQFLRQIRNFIFDLTKMPSSTADNDQPLVPTGIHWQVAQGTSLQNLVFNMPKATTGSNTTHVGIFTENGSGGFVSDLTFNGGNIGWRAGSQQYTARNLKFNDCLTAVQMVWDWGWTWQNIQISGGAIGFNISGTGGSTGQGIGSVSIIDSTISNVPVGILTNGNPTAPNIVLDNVVVNSVANVVQVSGGSNLLAASGKIDLWTIGKVYNGSVGSYVPGKAATAPRKAATLLVSGGSLFTRSRPQYESTAASGFTIATKDGGCKNDGTGDQATCINTFLQKAVSSKLIAFFPAGIYQIGSTVLIPTGSRVQGSSWSQIQGSGFYFSDMAHPKVMVQVGNKGEVGTMEIVEMLFSVRGNTAGAILMEWNVAASTQGAAAMWDSHFRVGGGLGTDLDLKNCPKFGYNAQCIAATLMFHVTKQASGYFENVWAWVADHDNDKVMVNQPDSSSSQISLYGARGMLIESQGPSWFYGTASEHSVLYNYQLSGAKDIFMGHIQTETPYYQPVPIAPGPFYPDIAASFANDPDFSNCHGDPSCAATWGLRVVNSDSVTIHGAGLYSFFQEYYQDCIDTFNCQQRILEVTGSTGVVIFNLYTVATSEIATGVHGSTIFQNDTNQRGFTTENAIWLPLPGSDNIDTVYVGTPVWTSTTVTCSVASCLLVFPTSPLATPTTIDAGGYATSFEYGGISSVTTNGGVTVIYVTSTLTTTLQIPKVTVTGMSYSNYNITRGASSFVISESVDIPDVTITLPDGSGGTTSRVIPLPPWPQILGGPTDSESSAGATSGVSNTYYSGLTATVVVSGSTVTTVSFPTGVAPTTINCPPQSEIFFATPSVTVIRDCPTSTSWVLSYACPTTKIVTFLSATTGLVQVDCSFVTLWPPAPTSAPPTTTSTTTTPLPIWTTWPPGAIVPIVTSVTKPEPTGTGVKMPCKLWFFNICIIFGKINVGGWYWSFPPGIYPGPLPPPIEWPPGFTLKGNLPKWPTITIGPDHIPTYTSEPDNECKTESASICSYGTSFQVTSPQGGQPTTTATATTSTCLTVYGCSVSDSGTTVTTTTVASCTPKASPNVKRAGDDPSCVVENAIVYPLTPGDAPSIIRLLTNNGLSYDTISSTNALDPSNNIQYTAYFWVRDLPFNVKSQLQNQPAIASVYYYGQFNLDNPKGINDDVTHGIPSAKGLDAEEASRRAEDPVSQPPSQYLQANESFYDPGTSENLHLWKRAPTSSPMKWWNPAMVSIPPGKYWRGIGKDKDGNSYGDADLWTGPRSGTYTFHYDDTAGEGMTVYITGEVGMTPTHKEFVGNVPRKLRTGSAYGYTPFVFDANTVHSVGIASLVEGIEIGICKKCSVVYSSYGYPPTGTQSPRDWYLEELLAVWDDMHTGGMTPATSVLNLSWGGRESYFVPAFIKRLYYILKKMDQAGVTIVIAAGNSGNIGRPTVDTYPQLFADPKKTGLTPFYQDPDDPKDVGYLPNLIVVGATNQFAQKADFSQTADFVTTYASGLLVNVAGTDPNSYGTESGTSYAAPQVAALAAYLKKLPSQWQDQLNLPDSRGPQAVKALINTLQRTIEPVPTQNKNNRLPTIWNGMSKTVNCLLDFPGGDEANGCPNLPSDITSCGTPGGAKARDLLAFRDNDILERQSGPVCSIPGSGNGGNGGNGGDGKTITFTSGPTPGPTCASSCGGHLCTGFWCSPTPTGKPPGFQDPKDPSSTGFTASQTSVSQGFSTGIPTTTTSKSTTTSSSTSIGGGGTPAPEPTAILRIMWDSEAYMDAVAGFSQWWFYAKPFGFDWNTQGTACDADGTIYGDDNIKANNIPFPDGTLKMPFKILGTADCTYTGTKTAPGTLTCPDLTTPVQCVEDTFAGAQYGQCFETQGIDTVYFKVMCLWD
ncbi:pectate lyase superfamily protein-domain-containing protein [Rhexocercosporidium sp. MPI-PUGE-AT-0058]|nr:pectate lyase superfamily protein-domain-containing protein [Rhexocercosporidium sp. MPI-PUGE-AT-0058]